MVIIETSIFTKRIKEAMSDDSYRELQNILIACPETGKIMKGSGGIRKVRWGTDDQGKRGGIRVIYYWTVNDNQIFMLLVYPKKERDNLTKQQLSLLKKIVKRELKNEQ